MNIQWLVVDDMFLTKVCIPSDYMDKKYIDVENIRIAIVTRKNMSWKVTPKSLQRNFKHTLTYMKSKQRNVSKHVFV